MAFPLFSSNIQIKHGSCQLYFAHSVKMRCILLKVLFIFSFLMQESCHPATFCINTSMQVKKSNMLILEKPLAEGMVRTCYFHPQDKQKCVKIVKDNKDIKSLEQELQIYHTVKKQLSPFICHYDNQLVETNKGPGLVGELICDDHGKVAQRLSDFLETDAIDQNIKEQFDAFFKALLDNRLYFTDFNLHNFLVFEQNGSYRITRSFIKLEVLFPFLWRKKTVRRMNHFYHRIGY